MSPHDAVLCGDRFAPITASIGFIRAPFAGVVEHLRSWRERIHGSADYRVLGGSLSESMRELAPLTGGVRPRELVAGTAEHEWTALFDCGLQGSDPVSTVGYLSKAMKVQGVAVTSIPDSQGQVGRPARFGARQFQLFGPLETEFLNFVRTVSVVREGARWRFDAAGTVQSFEDVEKYRSRVVSERFTPEMLIDYALALGLRPFDADYYSGPFALVTNPSRMPPSGLALSIEAAQRRAGIQPTCGE